MCIIYVHVYILYVLNIVPDGCSDPSEALQHFTEKFEQRYGVMHPLFYVGSLKDAVREATTGLHVSAVGVVFLYMMCTCKTKATVGA